VTRPTLVFGRAATQSDTGFRAFWDAYPRRQAKKDAQRAWANLRPDAATQEAILHALSWQRAQWPDLTYAPLPATWLRGERWQDEPLPETVKSPSRLPAWAQKAIKDRDD
jgi:hypothetical protein